MGAFVKGLSLPLFLLFLSLPISILAQSTSPAIESGDYLLKLRIGLEGQDFFGRRGISPIPDTALVLEKKSGGKAILFSALLPGLGQVYTKSYWKLPIIWGLGGYYVREWIKNNNRYRDFQDRYLKSISQENSQGDLQLRASRDFYRNQRDSFAWYFGILYLANIVDAYVSASLYEFDVSDDLSLQLDPSRPELTLQWKW